MKFPIDPAGKPIVFIEPNVHLPITYQLCKFLRCLNPHDVVRLQVLRGGLRGMGSTWPLEIARPGGVVHDASFLQPCWFSVGHAQVETASEVPAAPCAASSIFKKHASPDPGRLLVAMPIHPISVSKPFGRLLVLDSRIRHIYQRGFLLVLELVLMLAMLRTARSS